MVVVRDAVNYFSYEILCVFGFNKMFYLLKKKLIYNPFKVSRHVYYFGKTNGVEPYGFESKIVKKNI